MSAPTEKILKFHCRIMTYRGEGSRDMKKWARAEQRARRSFYKYVCKRGLYTPLEREEYQWRGETRVEFFRHPGNGYARGIPQWHASKSNPRDCWDYKFKRHRDAVEKVIEEKEMAERAIEMRVWERRYLIQGARASPLLKMVQAANAIKIHAESRSESR